MVSIYSVWHLYSDKCIDYRLVVERNYVVLTLIMVSVVALMAGLTSLDYVGTFDIDGIIMQFGVFDNI